MRLGGEVESLREPDDFAVEGVDGAADLRGGVRGRVEGGGHGGPEDAGVESVVAERHAEAVGGDEVPVRAGDALDQPAQPEPPEVVGGAVAVVLVDRQAEQRRDALAEVAVGEAPGQQAEGEHRGEQRLRPGVAEAQRRGALAVDHARGVEVFEPPGSDEAVVADGLGAQQAPVGGEAGPFQFVKVDQPPADSEVVGVVDHRLGAQRAPLLVVLLDARALVVDVQRRDDPAGDDAGSVPRRGAPGDAPVEDQLHVVGAPEVEVRADDVLEEGAPLGGPVEDLGEGELRLQDGEVVADARRAVRGRVRVRQARQPLAQQRVDPLRVQPFGQRPHGAGVPAAQDPVVERLERDAPLRELALQVLVPVDAQLRVVREVRAELDEQRAEVVVEDVHVVVVHHRRRRRQPRAHAATGPLAPLRAQHPRLLLGLADVQHALRPVVPAQVALRPLVLPLEAPERHEVDAPAPREVLHLRHEAPRHRRHQRRRRHRVPPDVAEEVRRPGARLQHRHVHVQVHAVDALQFQDGVLGHGFGRRSCYAHAAGSGRWAPHRPLYGQRRHARPSRRIRNPRSGAAAGACLNASRRTSHASSV